MGGAITVVGTTVIILDRLGSLYRCDLITGSFAAAGIPRLPNNLDAYLVQRPGPPVNLADAPNDEFGPEALSSYPIEKSWPSLTTNLMRRLANYRRWFRLFHLML
jgi:hypothetical protein